MQAAYLVYFWDLVQFAAKLGYSREFAIDFLDDFRPQYEIASCNVDLEDWLDQIEEGTCNPDKATVRIIKEFCKEHDVTEFVVVDQ